VTNQVTNQSHARGGETNQVTNQRSAKMLRCTVRVCTVYRYAVLYSTTTVLYVYGMQYCTAVQTGKSASRQIG
jgi:hypothetical protein